MDLLLENFRNNLTICENEYQAVEIEFARLKSKREHLENTCNSIKTLIEEREKFLAHSSKENSYLNGKDETETMESETVGGQVLDDEIEYEENNTSDENAGVIENTEINNLQSRYAQIKYGMFDGMKLIEAVVLYLRLMKTGQSTRQISEALLKGGYQTTARDFTDTVRSTLKQYKSPKGPILWVNNKWELKEWIPLSN